MYPHHVRHGYNSVVKSCRPGTHGVNFKCAIANVSVTIRGITWFALGVKNEVFCIAQKTIAHERVQIIVYETQILLSYLWYLSRYTNLKTPVWRDISALGALHNIDMIYIFIGYFWWFLSIELINIGLVHTYLCIKTHIDKFNGKNHEGWPDENVCYIA